MGPGSSPCQAMGRWLGGSGIIWRSCAREKTEKMKLRRFEDRIWYHRQEVPPKPPAQRLTKVSSCNLPKSEAKLSSISFSRRKLAKRKFYHIKSNKMMTSPPSWGVAKNGNLFRKWSLFLYIIIKITVPEHILATHHHPKFQVFGLPQRNDVWQNEPFSAGECS